MKRNTSKEALYERMRSLAEVNKKTVSESNNRTLGTLIDYKRAADGVAYGIIKENHHYYIKKGGLKQDPNVADFAYIGGLQNIKEYQFESLAKADKQRNMIFNTINEAITSKPSVNGGKKRLNEDKAAQEIDMAAEKIGDLDAATAAEKTPSPAPEGGDEMSAGLDAMPTDAAPEGNEEVPTEEPIPAPEGGEEIPTPETGEEVPAEEPAPEGGEEEVPTEEPTGDEMTGDEEPKDDIKSDIGKIGEKVMDKTLDDKKVVDYVKMFLGYFKDNFVDMPIEDREELAAKILEVTKDKNIKDLENTMPSEPVTGDEEGIEEEQCSECGSFARYAESRGYGSAEALMECGEEEVGNLISGYANAHNDGMNDGDLENVALVIKVINPEMLNSLKGDYGHEEYADKLTPMVQGMNESTAEENVAKLNELFGGLKSAFGTAAKPLKQATQAVGTAIGKGAQAVQQYGQGVKQAYHAGEVNTEVKKLETLANSLGQQVAALNTRLQKAGKQPVNVNSILTTIKNQVGKGGAANLAGRVQEGGIDDPANIQIQPLEEIELPEKNDDETTEIGFAPAGQSLGGGVVKPEGAPTTGIDISVDGNSKTVNIAVNEVVEKLKEVIEKMSKGITNEENKVPFIDGAKIVKEEKPSAGLSKEKKSEVVKAAKKGEDIGKKGKGFKEVEKKAKESGATDPKAVAAAAMWKNIKREGTEEKPAMSESELKLRKYIRNRLEENAGVRKPMLNESKKSETLKKLDAMIDSQFKLYESVILKKLK